MKWRLQWHQKTGCCLDATADHYPSGEDTADSSSQAMSIAFLMAQRERAIVFVNWADRIHGYLMPPDGRARSRRGFATDAEANDKVLRERAR